MATSEQFESLRWPGGDGWGDGRRDVPKSHFFVHKSRVFVPKLRGLVPKSARFVPAAAVLAGVAAEVRDAADDRERRPSKCVRGA